MAAKNAGEKVARTRVPCCGLDLPLTTPETSRWKDIVRVLCKKSTIFTGIYGKQFFAKKSDL